MKEINCPSRFSLPLQRLLSWNGIAALWLGCLAIPAYGNTFIWSGGGNPNFNWKLSANWFSAGIPANGDTVVFQGATGLVNTNDIANLALNQIRFQGPGGGFDLRGNAFTLTNNIECTNSAGTNSIENNITLAVADPIIDVTSTLTLSGILSGSVGLIKNGGGTLLINGPSSNTYGGTTTVNAGLLQLDKIGVPFAATAIPGDLVIGNGLSSATVRNLTILEIADTCNVTINQFGLWDLNNFSETVGASLVLDGAITTGSGICTLSPNNTITVTGSGSISGNLNLGSGTCTIQNDGNLEIPAVISGSANITKNGVGSIHFSAANTFTGSFTANGENYVWVTNPLGLGATNGGTTLNDSTWLALSGNITVSNETLTLNSAWTNGTIYVYAGDTNTWAGPLSLNTNTTILAFTNCGLVLGGSISGPGGFTKIQPGVLTLAGPGGSSSYAGDTTLKEGILFLNSANVIRHGTLTVGDGLGGANADIVKYLSGGCIFGGPGGSKVIIRSSGLLDLNGFFDDVGPIEMDGGKIVTGATGLLSLFPPLVTYSTDPTNGACTFNGNLQLREDSTFGITNDFTLAGTLSSSFTDTFTKTGPRFMYLTGSNTYTGLTVVQQGWLEVQNASGLGATNFGTVVSNHASLVLLGGFGITNEPLTLNGVGALSTWGALDIETVGTNIWNGPITVNADSTITAFGSSSGLRIIGSIDGLGGVTTLADGRGTIYFEGSTSNTYAGLTRVFGGTLNLNKPLFDSTIPGDLVIGDGFGGANSDVVRLLDFNQIPNTANVTINSSGLLDLTTFVEGIGTISGTGNIILGTQLLDMYGTSTYTFDGVISGTGRFRQQSTGTAILTGANSYTGSTDINFPGAILVNGSQPQSAVHVNDSSATFGGSGVVGEILCAGNLRPGSSPGILTCSNLTLTSTANLYLDLDGSVAGSGYDQLNVRGTNNLASAALHLNPTFSHPVSVGDQLIVINNDGTDPITGSFLAWPPGTSLAVNGFNLVISYTGGTGNDVAFTVTKVPGNAVSSSVTAGNGDHIIGLNECNNLNLVVTNQAGTPMTGINETLSTTTPGVLITQPYSTCPNIPAGSNGANDAPFQISTLTNFVCGTDINLELSVDSSLGSFTVNFVQHTGALAVSPNRYDNGLATSIPDVGSIDSTNLVSGFVGPLDKVSVAIYLTHTFDSDLTNLSLISPDGTTVLLSSANGAGGQNYGNNCSPDASRTTFDDAAGASITSGAAPFVGTFRPQSPLSAFIGNGTPNGNWRLRVADGFGGSLGTLRCWSLFLYGTACSSGSGSCDTCLPPISGAITAGSPVQTNRYFRDLLVSSCASPKSWGGFGGSGTNFHYQSYTFTNTTPADACVTVELQSPSNLTAAAYLTAFDPANIATNFLGDAGFSTGTDSDGLNGPTTFSVAIPAGAKFIVTVNEVIQNSGAQPYTLSLSGLPCPPPTLAIDPLIPAPNVRVHWPTSAGGYKLEGTPSLSPATWAGVTNEPIVTGSEYGVTNSAPPENLFYRLNKP